MNQLQLSKVSHQETNVMTRVNQELINTHQDSSGECGKTVVTDTREEFQEKDVANNIDANKDAEMEDGYEADSESGCEADSLRRDLVSRRRVRTKRRARTGARSARSNGRSGCRETRLRSVRSVRIR